MLTRAIPGPIFVGVLYPIAAFTVSVTRQTPPADNTPTASHQRHILSAKRVSVDARSLSRASGRGRIAPHVVDIRSDGLKVLGIYTPRILAEMVNLVTAGNWPNKQSVDHSICRLRPAW